MMLLVLLLKDAIRSTHGHTPSAAALAAAFGADLHGGLRRGRAHIPEHDLAVARACQESPLLQGQVSQLLTSR